jgi:hypothetical protein
VVPDSNTISTRSRRRAVTLRRAGTTGRPEKAELRWANDDRDGSGGRPGNRLLDRRDGRNCTPYFAKKAIQASPSRSGTVTVCSTSKKIQTQPHARCGKEVRRSGERLVEAAVVLAEQFLTYTTYRFSTQSARIRPLVSAMLVMTNGTQLTTGERPQPNRTGLKGPCRHLDLTAGTSRIAHRSSPRGSADRSRCLGRLPCTCRKS